MRILVDAMCAEFGGIRTYVEHLLARWELDRPEDELHVLVPAGMSLPTGRHTRHEITVRSPRMVFRPLAQTRAIRAIVRDVDAEVVIATAPNTTLLRPGVPLAVVILDLRHELRPEQFSRLTRLLRRISYGRSYRIADRFLAISQRSLDDLHELHPSVRDVPSAVTYLGADHVMGWGDPDTDGPAVTFAHHTNKNPDLVLDGWGALVARHGEAPPLLMLGVGDQRERLAEDIDRRGLGRFVTLAPFLPDGEFQRILSSARMIVFPSDFEGFGLPVVEGMFLGKPVVIGPERATTEIAGGHAQVMASWQPEALADAVEKASRQDDEQRAAAVEHGRTFTWSRTVAQTREALEAMI